MPVPTVTRSFRVRGDTVEMLCRATYEPGRDLARKAIEIVEADSGCCVCCSDVDAGVTGRTPKSRARDRRAADVLARSAASEAFAGTLPACLPKGSGKWLPLPCPQTTMRYDGSLKRQLRQPLRMSAPTRNADARLSSLFGASIDAVCLG